MTDHDNTGAGAFSGIVLSGGTAARLGGLDKSGIVVEGRTLLDSALAAFSDAAQIVVVGPGHPTTDPRVRFIREDPPLGGPAAGLLAGVHALRDAPSMVGVLAVDMPRITAGTMARLRQAAVGHDGAFVHDAGGHRQLAGVLTGALVEHLTPAASSGQGLSIRRLLSGLDLVEVAAIGEEARDIDSPADLDDFAG